MNLLAKIFLFAWIAIGGVLGAYFGGVGAAQTAGSSLLAYAGPISPVSVFGLVTLLYGVSAWRLSKSRHAREDAAIIRDKPALANDKDALKRERRVREKEARLQKAEQKALRRENRAEKKEVKVSKKENKLEREREEITMKKDALREKERLGR